MPLQASNDRELGRTGERQRRTGSHLLLLGGVLFAVGLLLMVLFSGENVPVYIGAALAALAAPPTLGGLALFLSGLVSGRSAKQKPFA
jgi:VIT1/CCC1 family predicted Fe2+/Mn2+ transporter